MPIENISDDAGTDIRIGIFKVCNDRKQAILSSRDERDHAVIVIRVAGRKNVAIRPRIMRRRPTVDGAHARFFTCHPAGCRGS